MNADELTFGIEFEVTIPAGTVLAIGGYHNGVQVPELPQGWTAQGDGSIHATARGHRGVEIVSPILKGIDGLEQIKRVCEWLNRVGAKVNSSTGCHVHVGFDRNNRDALRRLVNLVANFERALIASTGTHNRENNRYCRPVQSDNRFISAFRDQDTGVGSFDRYHVLNLTNLLYGTKPTVEFRVFAGTTSATKAIGHVLTCLAMVEKSLRTKKATKWIAKNPVETSPIHRNGEGQTALTRLFYALGWTKGREPHTFGDLQAEGLPTIKAIKKELMRLAKKFDKGAQS